MVPSSPSGRTSEAAQRVIQWPGRAARSSNDRVSGIVFRQVVDVDALTAWTDVLGETFTHDFVGLSANDVEEARPRLAGVVVDERFELWLGEVGGRPVAAGQLTLPLCDNLETSEVEAYVRPTDRGQGHGGGLLELLLGRVRDHGRIRAILEVPELAPPAGAEATPAQRLARAAGARPVLRNVRRMLTGSDVTDETIADLRSEAERYGAGYELVHWVDRAPADLHDNLAALMALMSTDVPLGELDWEPEAWDGARWAGKEQLAIAQGRRRFATAARELRTGRLVGYTDIGVNPRLPQYAYQWDTIVAGAHRGHRLGLLMKAANLQLMRASSPEVRWLNTWNAESNDHMIGVNDRLGFRPMERWIDWQLDLASVPAPAR